MRAVEFIEVLEAQIRREIAAEVAAEVAAKLRSTVAVHQPRASESDSARGARDFVETWLVAHLPTSQFSRNQAGRRAYRTVRPVSASKAQAPQTPSPTRAEARLELDTPEALVAYEVLARHTGAKMVKNITESELKSLWRRAALQAHPDRHAGASQEKQRRQASIFRELTEAYGVLLKLF